MPKGVNLLTYVHACHIYLLYKTDGLKVKDKLKATVCPGSRGVFESSERFQ